ncbi:cytosolic phospholipase A2-like isoform X2 [Mytilus californianus]|nr:cytosolic phospholipase A2-like isoform X2 [Mytilus californianus]XP_052097954.1 cytosolic phospholipase A2-like isoform X2 [Mytilus californianus]XP_052097955.1 cytosolic phospholipase A2-like isoform X3 [Mytilus californianus]XP_052097956.1 cytosolic phospholipase A2-like isoform X2 [Mytilus californianus]
MPGNERSESKYQYYKLNSPFAFVKIDITVKNDFRTWGVVLAHIGLKKNLLLVNQHKFTTFMDEGSSISPSAWNETFRFIVEKKELKKMDELMFDIRLLSFDKTDFQARDQLQSISLEKLTEPAVDVKFSHAKIEFDVMSNPHTDVKFRNVNQLCSKEEMFVEKRRERVFLNLKRQFGLHKISEVTDTPNIAIIGSGGGLRAVIGMSAAMTALKERGILESTMYTAGLSGSAWYLMSLYSCIRPNATELNTKLRETVPQIRSNMFLYAWYTWKYYTSWLHQFKNKNITVADPFGYLISSFLLQKNVPWSEQANKLKNGAMPLPLIAALHVREEKSIEDYHEWIEFSPYEVFIPKYGAAIDMEKFGDTFYGGFAMDEGEEKTIHFLNGMCGSGYAILRNFRPAGMCGNEKEIEENIIQAENPWNLFRLVYSSVKDMVRPMFSEFDKKFVGKVPNWLRGISTDEPLFPGPESSTDLIDFKEDFMMLVDAGLAFNSPYPTVLHPSRKVDVILSFDFSYRGTDSEWPFRQLEKAEEWARKRCIPFPKLKLDTIKKKCKDGNYEEVYVFKEDDSPIIVHFVMINKSFRKIGDGKHDFDINSNYHTMRLNYSEEEYNKLNSLVQHNVLENEKKIVDCISEAIHRKQKKKKKNRLWKE